MGLTKRFLEQEIQQISKRVPEFTEMVDAFLANPEDPTGLRISNIRMVAQFIAQDFDRLCSLLEKQDEERRE